MRKIVDILINNNLSQQISRKLRSAKIRKRNIEQKKYT